MSVCRDSLKNFTIESILSNNHDNVKVAMNKNYVRCFKHIQQNIMLTPIPCFGRISMPLHSFRIFPSLSVLNKHSGKYSFERTKENKGNQKKENQNIIKCKARRQSFNILQTTFLEKQFTKQRYIDTEQRNKFSAILGLTPQQVKIWYQNRRYKEKIGIKALNNIK